MDYIPLWETMTFKCKKLPGPAGKVSGTGHQWKKRNHVGLYVHRNRMGSEVSKMDRDTLFRSEKIRLKDVDLVSPGGNRLGSSEAKVILPSRSHLPWERR